MIIYIAVNTIIFSILMFIYNIKQNKNIGLLSAYLIIYSLYSIAHYSTFFSNDPVMVAFGWNNFSPFYMLAGPTIYFYVKSSLEDKIIWKWIHLLHLIPFFLVTIGIIPYWMIPFNEKIVIGERIVQDVNNMKLIRMNWIFSNLFIYFSRPLTVIVYIFACFMLLFKKMRIEKNPTRQFTLFTRWISILLSISLLLITILAMMGSNLFKNDVRTMLDKYQDLHALAGGLFLMLPLSLLLFPQILYGVPIIESHVTINLPINQHDDAPKKSSPTFNKNQEAFKQLSNRILEYFDKEQPFLKQNFSLTDLAVALHVPQHHISYCFSDFLETTFTKLRSAKRIEYAQDLLRQGITKDFTIDKVAEMSGFSSRSTFFSTFKEITGMTPTEFMEQSKSS